ncbi:unnamed protein product [Parnassius mnemosyne]|uniref:Uncharacterized protein n=1 Tax=Parnassius mnemosyne TaxID=213953 RepID=A0AAV1L0P6_9NEOP
MLLRPQEQRKCRGPRRGPSIRFRTSEPHHPLHHQSWRELTVLHLPAALGTVRSQRLPDIDNKIYYIIKHFLFYL